MRLSSVIRWLLLVPSAVVAWYFVFFISLVLHEVVVGRCFDSDAPPPDYCQASWFPRDFLHEALVFFGVGLSAVVVVFVAALVAPSHKRHVAWVALAAGAALAIVAAYGAGAVAEAGVAIVAGVLAAVVVSRATIGSRHATVARTNVVPNA
jgi:hypothetical protein